MYELEILIFNVSIGETQLSSELGNALLILLTIFASYIFVSNNNSKLTIAMLPCYTRAHIAYPCP